MQHGNHGLSHYRTSVETDEQGKTRVVYYATAVVVFDRGEIVLNTGGWWTATTRLRMNQASREFGLEYLVFMKEGKWYVRYGEQDRPFDAERVRLDRKSGEVKPVG